ncbi:Peptidoglycan-associated lipoprotein [Emticicia aquatica]|jgi:chemotaxis protein MotB|uniref:Peptidoglycan-associated lipoprotein n=1 Tax=Emticicia aquatica TaxID=1681835 RepID=A0ABN8EXL4_9BACT|nr:OmpA family protein [Emticicia aquatica]CAH0996410.1 Peptidoglycan-associated lipoprotein [Emticicia aquatica]
MKISFKPLLVLLVGLSMASCVAKKKLTALQSQYDKAQADLVKCGDNIQDYKDKLDRLTKTQQETENQKNASLSTIQQRDLQISDLKDQVADLKKLRDKQMEQVGNLTVLSKAANDNIDKTLSQLASKDKYINLLQAARTKADSINLALAVNLKSVLNNGIDDQDVEIKVDKTVVMINISDKMLFSSGSSKISSNANNVLGKIAQIIKSRPDLDVMVEGYTDNVAINTDCINDNWDLSVKRATSVVRTLQQNFSIDPNKLIAAGRGEYNTLTTNDTAEGRATNRRTRIILMPKLDQFYDLLNPDKK